MNDHAEHAALLAELLSRDDAGARFEASKLAACAECRAILEEHQSLLDELGQLARDERASMTAAAELAPEPGRAEAALRARVLADTSAARGRPGSTLRHWLLIAAAAVFFALIGSRVMDDGGSKDGGVLGPEEQLLHPLGEVEGAFAPFRWNVELPDGAWFSLHVVGEGLDLESGRVTAQEWSPTEEVVWPAEIRWTLEVRRGTGIGEVVKSFVEWAEH